MAAFSPAAHFRIPGRGGPGWGQTQRWNMAGADPSISVYDQPSASRDPGLWTRIKGGFVDEIARMPLSAPTMTRRPRASAIHVTTPAARFFQSYTGAGTGRNWQINPVAYVPHTPLYSNFNPNMQGNAELWPATTYDPYPSPSALYPKAV